MDSSSHNRYLPSDPSSFNPDEGDIYGDGRVRNNLLEELYPDFGEADSLDFGNYYQYGLQDVSLTPNPANSQRSQSQLNTSPSLPYSDPFGQDGLETNTTHNRNGSQMSPMSKLAYPTSHHVSRSFGVALPMLSPNESVYRPRIQPLLSNSTTEGLYGCDARMKLQHQEETKVLAMPNYNISESHSVGRSGSTCSFLAEGGTEHLSVGSKRQRPRYSESQSCAKNQSMRGFIPSNPVKNERLAEYSQPHEGGHFEGTSRNASCSNSNSSSPGFPASKRQRTINSGMDLFSEVTEAYGFVRGANIYAPTTHPTFPSQDTSRAVQPHQVYHFDYSKTINFNFHGADANSGYTANPNTSQRHAEGSASFSRQAEYAGAKSRCSATVSGYRCSESTDSYRCAEGTNCTFSNHQPMQGLQDYLNNASYTSQCNRPQGVASTGSPSASGRWCLPAGAAGSLHPAVPSRVIGELNNSSAAAAYVQDESIIYNRNLQKHMPVGLQAKSKNSHDCYAAGYPALHHQQDTSASYKVSYRYPGYSNLPGYSNTSSNACSKVESTSNNYLVNQQHFAGNSRLLPPSNMETAYGNSYSSCRKSQNSAAYTYYTNAAMYQSGLETIPEFFSDPSSPGENTAANFGYSQTVRDPTWSPDPASIRSLISRSSSRSNVPLIQQSFMKNFIGEGSEPYQTHYLFSLLRDLIIADMNYNTSKFPFSLINNLPTDFDRLLQNYFARNPKIRHQHHNPQVDQLVTDALRHAHKTLLEPYYNAQGINCSEHQFMKDTTLDISVAVQVPRASENLSQKIRIHQGGAGHPAASNSDIMAGLCENFQKFSNTGNNGDFSALRSFGGDSNYSLQKRQTITKPVPLGSDLVYQCDMSPSMNPMFIAPSHYNPHSPASTCLSLTTSEGQLDVGDASFEKTNKNKVLPREAVEVMTDWLREHQTHPYPNDDEKEMFLNRTKLTINQINYWFTNARRRLLPKWELKQRLEKEEHAKNDSGSNQSNAIS